MEGEGQTFRDGLLGRLAIEAGAWLNGSAGVTGEGSAKSTTLGFLATSMFSWELGGSRTSLLGTGVMFVGRLILERELERLVDSCRQGED